MLLIWQYLTFISEEILKCFNNNYFVFGIFQNMKLTFSMSRMENARHIFHQFYETLYSVAEQINVENSLSVFIVFVLICLLSEFGLIQFCSGFKKHFIWGGVFWYCFCLGKWFMKVPTVWIVCVMPVFHLNKWKKLFCCFSTVKSSLYVSSLILRLCVSEEKMSKALVN